MKNLFNPTKKIKFDFLNDIDMSGPDGNAFMLLGIFRRQAKVEGWTEDEIMLVINEAKSSDYDHLVDTLLKHSK